MDLRINGLYRHDPGQLEQRPGILAIDAGARAAIRRDFDSGLPGRVTVCTAVYGQLGLAVPDEPFTGTGAKRPSAAEQENRFEDGGFAGAIFPGDQIEFGRELKRC